MSREGSRPTPEKLAAYADGELHGDERAAVEAWLDNCPEALAELEAVRRLACLCRRTAAAEPAPDAWDATLARIHAALPAPRPRPLPRPARLPFVPALGSAAAVVAAVLMGRAFWPAAPPPAPRPAPALTAPLDLADTRDVDIISMDAGDARTLLVGRPPVAENLVLAAPGDVTLLRAEPLEGVVPDMRQDGAAPVIVPSPADAP